MAAGLLLTAAAILAMVAASDPASAITNCTPPAGEAGLNATEQQLLAAINNLRANPPAGFSAVPALKNSPTLSQAAAWKSFDSSASGAGFSHTDSLGRSPGQRAADCGHPSGVGENIAYGYGSVQSVMAAWIASPGHLNNMLLPYYKVVGIGLASGGRWTTDFSAHDDSGVSPPTNTQPPPPQNTNTPIPTNPPPPTATPKPPSTGFAKNLGAGSNAVVHSGASIPVSQAFESVESALLVVYHWNSVSRQWERYVPNGPGYTRSFDSLVAGQLYVIVMSSPATWTY